MRVRRLLAVAVLLVLMPGHADAAGARGFWVWLEELSGPGYFGGGMVSFGVACWNAKGARVRCTGERLQTADEREALGAKTSVRLTGGVLSSFHRSRFDNPDVAAASGIGENTEPVYAIPIFATYTLRTGASFELGTGGGLLAFAGSGVNSNVRPIWTPVTVSWKFLRRGSSDMSIRNQIALEGQTYYIFPGFNGTSFSSTENGFSSPPELKGSIGISFSFGER